MWDLLVPAGLAVVSTMVYAVLFRAGLAWYAHVLFVAVWVAVIVEAAFVARRIDLCPESAQITWVTLLGSRREKPVADVVSIRRRGLWVMGRIVMGSTSILVPHAYNPAFEDFAAAIAAAHSATDLRLAGKRSWTPWHADAALLTREGEVR